MIDWCNIQGKLYDKSDQIEQLLQAYRRQTRQQEDPMHQQDNDESLLVSLTSASLATPSHQFTNEFVLITGPSGVGKTALACTLQEQVEQDGGYFIRGKFEQPTTITDDLAEIGATLATGPEQQQQQQRQQQQVANSAMTPVHDNNTGPFATALSQYASLAILKARQRQRLRRRQLRDQCSTGVAITSSSNCNKDNELESLQIALERELDTSELQVLAENIPALQPILINNHQHNINNDNNTVTSTAGSDKDSSHPPNHPTTTATTTTTTATTSGGWRGLQGPDAEKYYRHMLSKFVTAIRNTTTMSHPLVLLLDDLQWADQRSLELIQMMLTRQSNHASSGLVILATVRSLLEEEQPSSSNNIHQTTNDNNHPTSNNALVFSLLQELQEHGVGTTHLQVSNLGQDAVQELMSDLFQHASRECNALLADRVHRLTGGNVFFIFQLLRFWEGEGRLMMCGSDDDDGDDRKVAALPYPLYQMINDDIPSVMELVVKRIQQLPFNVQEVLKMASCMGTIISERLLKEAGSVGMSPLSIEPALAVAHEQGLVVYDSSSTTESVSFVHDKIQKAAYSLIPESERAMLHLHIGRALWVWLAYEELDRHIFLVTNQITRGLHLVDDPVEKEELAELYLRAGLKTAQSTLFTQASAYFEMGISLLGRRHWKRHYKLSLDLYNAAAEVEYYGGNLVRVDFLLNRVLRHAKSLDDKLHAYYTQIYSLASRDDTNQAFSIGFEVLRQLGVTFPERLRAIRTRVAWHNCIKKLRQMGDDSIIMNLPVMQDKRQLMIMRLLNTLMMSAFSARQELVVPMLISMVNRTLQHGICGASCIGLGYLGSYMGRHGNFDEGHRFVQLGLRIMERFDAKEWQSRLALGVYGGFYTTRHPVRESIKPLLAARRAGLVVGDIYSACVCASLQHKFSLYAAVRLPDLLEDLQKCRRFCAQYGQRSADTIFSHKQQLCLNFVEKVHDPVTLTGKAMDEDENIRTLEGKHLVSLAGLLLMKHMLAVYFNEFEVARTTAARFRAMKVDGILEVSVVIHEFLEGLAAAVLSRTERNEIWRAQRICKRLKTYQSISPENFTNKVCLLEAEIAAVNGDEQFALSKYLESIDAAGREGFLHEQALACERASCSLLQWGNVAEGQHYLHQACSVYEQWGAFGKVAQLQQRFKSLLYGSEYVKLPT